MLARLSTSVPISFDPSAIKIVEEARKCRYIGTSSIPVRKPDLSLAHPGGDALYCASKEAKDFEWSYQPLDIFWQTIPHPDSKERLFGLYRRDGKVFIRSTNWFSGIVDGVYIPSTNRLSYSVHRHDFFGPNDKEPNTPRVCVDGGRDYLRVLGHKDDYRVVTIDLVNMRYRDGDEIHRFELEGF